MIQIIAYVLVWIMFGIGYYMGRSSSKDANYIKGYRDGIKDGGSSIQEIMNKLKKEL